MQAIPSTLLAIAMIAALLLVLGGFRLLRDRQWRLRGVLMMVAALVIVMNVMIWTM